MSKADIPENDKRILEKLQSYPNSNTPTYLIRIEQKLDEILSILREQK